MPFTSLAPILKESAAQVYRVSFVNLHVFCIYSCLPKLTLNDPSVPTGQVLTLMCKHWPNITRLNEAPLHL